MSIKSSYTQHFNNTAMQKKQLLTDKPAALHLTGQQCSMSGISNE